MKRVYDMRCIQKTARRNLACSTAVSIQHVEHCFCTPENIMPNKCPCGEPRHQGMCRDAIIAGQGREVPVWKAE